MIRRALVTFSTTALLSFLSPAEAGSCYPVARCGEQCHACHSVTPVSDCHADACQHSAIAINSCGANPCGLVQSEGVTPSQMGFSGITPSTPLGVDTDGAVVISIPVTNSVRQTVGNSSDPDDDLRIRELIQRILVNELKLSNEDALDLIDEYREPVQ